MHIHSKLIAIAAIFFVMLSSAAQTKTTAKPATKPVASTKSDALTNKNIIDLQKAGLGDEIILSKIARSKCAFDLSTDGLIDLKSKGVSADVIKAMMNKNESEMGEKHQVPVNISKLDNGVYKIVPGRALEKGEYFFTTKSEATATSFDVYTFGIK